MSSRNWIALLLCLSFLFTFNPHAVFACSGGSPLTVRGSLDLSDYFIRSVVVESDDLGQNAIIRVVSYLAGGPGPEYLLLERNNATLIAYSLAGRSSGGDCLGLHPELTPGDSFYAFVKRDIDGSYHIVDTLFNSGYFSFTTEETTAEVFLEGMTEDENYAEKGSGQQVTEAELINIIIQETGTDPVEPNLNSPYPLKAPISIVTDSDVNNHYLLPVDFAFPILDLGIPNNLSDHPLWNYGFSDAGTCLAEKCWQVSPDNLNIAVSFDSDTLRFTWGEQVTAQAAQFSSTSDTVAVWNECELTVYTIGYPRLGEERYALTELNQRALSPQENCRPFHHAASWSPDGRLLAYADANGLWLWDVFTSTQPRLLIATDNHVVPQPRYFSPLGRYLAVVQGELYRNLDLVSGNFVFDGVISPDDRILIHYDTRVNASDWEICVLAPFNCSSAGWGMYYEDFDQLGERQRLYELTHVQEVHWINPSKFLTVACVPNQPQLCSYYEWTPSHDSWYGERVAQGHAFDYDNLNNTYVFVIGDNHIFVNGHEVNLNGAIEGEIVKVNWMRSLFYRH